MVRCRVRGPRPRSSLTRMSLPAPGAVTLTGHAARRQAPAGVVTYPPSEGHVTPRLPPGLTRLGPGGLGLTLPAPRARRRRLAARRLAPGPTPTSCREPLTPGPGGQCLASDGPTAAQDASRRRRPGVSRQPNGAGAKFEPRPRARRTGLSGHPTRIVGPRVPDTPQRPLCTSPTPRPVHSTPDARAT
jgi:hypothetical protein